MAQQHILSMHVLITESEGVFQPTRSASSEEAKASIGKHVKGILRVTTFNNMSLVKKPNDSIVKCLDMVGQFAQIKIFTVNSPDQYKAFVCSVTKHGYQQKSVRGQPGQPALSLGPLAPLSCLRDTADHVQECRKIHKEPA